MRAPRTPPTSSISAAPSRAPRRGSTSRPAPSAARVRARGPETAFSRHGARPRWQQASRCPDVHRAFAPRPSLLLVRRLVRRRLFLRLVALARIARGELFRLALDLLGAFVHLEERRLILLHELPVRAHTSRELGRIGAGVLQHRLGHPRLEHDQGGEKVLCIEEPFVWEPVTLSPALFPWSAPTVRRGREQRRPSRRRARGR